jgi:hypothetical protein
VTFDQLTQYVIEVDGVPTVMPLTVTDTPMPEPESTGEPFVPYTPPPTLDERVATVEETIGVIFGGA